jgi:hypothetical protein
VAARRTNTAGGAGRSILRVQLPVVDLPSSLALFVAPEGSMSTKTLPAAPPQAADTDIYLSAADCIRRHPALSRNRIYRAAVVGAVRTRLIPGVPPRYNAADLDRVMAERRA